MTAERWQKLKPILHECLELKGEARQIYLDVVCSTQPGWREDLEQLLSASDQTSVILDTPVFQPRPVNETLVGTRLGPYQIIEEIGRGGMGTVYRALRDDEYQQEVAIKLVKRGMDTDAVLERFRQERQLLAFLNHPWIGRLLDGGTSPDGRPYFVMEIIEGRPVTEHCDSEKLGLRQRLALFREICEAVEYAHRHLIVHRDLKPGNIMVTSDGHPKLVDFGIAKLVVPNTGDSRLDVTDVNARIFTPDYASPEQARGDSVTTATDVYSLGAVLYELLTKTKAHRFTGKSPSEIERAICTEAPPKASASPDSPWRRELIGDLDNILIKALHKNPAERYLSVEQFSEDLRRYLDGQPVLAAPQPMHYRVEKFLRRNWRPVAFAAAVAAALISTSIFALWQARIAKEQEQLAEARLADVRKLADSMIFEVESAIATQSPVVARQLLVTRAVDYLDRIANQGAKDQSTAAGLAAAYEKMGDVLGRPSSANTGQTSEALKSYHKALAIRQDVAVKYPYSPEAESDLAACYQRISAVTKVAGDYKTALGLDRQALSILEDLLRTDPANPDRKRDLASALVNLGGTLTQLGDWETVMETRVRTVDILEELVKANPTNPVDLSGLALAHSRLGGILLVQKDPKRATEEYGKAVALGEKLVAAQPNNNQYRLSLGASYAAQAAVLAEGGKYLEALPLYQHALLMRRTVSAADPKEFRAASLTATSHTRLGQTLVKAGRTSDGLAEIEKGLAIRERLAQENPMNAGAQGEVAESHGLLGDAWHARGNTRKSREAYTRALKIYSSLREKSVANAVMETDAKRLEALLKPSNR